MKTQTSAVAGITAALDPVASAANGTIKVAATLPSVTVGRIATGAITCAFHTPLQHEERC